MFIKNINNTTIDCYRCNQFVANYLMKNNIPLLSFDSNVNQYVFSNNDDLKSVINNAPLWIKIFT